ncbi:hypothetical protein TRFO_31900 [Tritrichomonas foetus]|uniref:Uncharacterized protein n=1 Tax=Tritrichomonas foetus TaxID=1144522 RepID=A0A1J4JVK8_9EUKA|nr:hypothetical protein TRFO_31900 [Tritrichomonas foetus]|eukprot:OHT01309.1 hypothetical protein TRFO_31900 [Tritrichomonas foetus]
MLYLITRHLKLTAYEAENPSNVLNSTQRKRKTIQHLQDPQLWSNAFHFGIGDFSYATLEEICISAMTWPNFSRAISQNWSTPESLEWSPVRLIQIIILGPWSTPGVMKTFILFRKESKPRFNGKIQSLILFFHHHENSQL